MIIAKAAAINLRLGRRPRVIPEKYLKEKKEAAIAIARVIKILQVLATLTPCGSCAKHN